MFKKSKRQKRYLRHKKVRAKIFGTAKKPRLCVFRSTKHIYGQLIDDEKRKTILSVSDLKLKTRKATKETKVSKKAKDKLSGKSAIAFEVGKLIAQKAKELKLKQVVFDRGGYLYHGRVRALAEGARKGGLKF